MCAPMMIDLRSVTIFAGTGLRSSSCWSSAAPIVNQQDANGMTPLRLACERRIGHNGVGYRDDQREQRMVDIIEELAVCIPFTL